MNSNCVRTTIDLKNVFRHPEHVRGGEIFFGGTDSELYLGEMIYSRLTSPNEWRIQLNG